MYNPSVFVNYNTGVMVEGILDNGARAYGKVTGEVISFGRLGVKEKLIGTEALPNSLKTKLIELRVLCGGLGLKFGLHV